MEDPLTDSVFVLMCICLFLSVCVSVGGCHEPALID